MWIHAKKFFMFIGVFIVSNIILSIITGLILTYMYEESGYQGSPIIGTLINVTSAVIAIFIAYKPLKKNERT